MADQYERVLLRLVGTEDVDFSDVIYKLLPLVLRKLLEPTLDTGSQKKVIEILNHVLQRAKANARIFLPLFAILELIRDEQAQAASAAAGGGAAAAAVQPPLASKLLFKNLSMIYLALAVERLEQLAASDKAEVEVPLGSSSVDGAGGAGSSIGSWHNDKLPAAAAAFFKSSRVSARASAELISAFHLFDAKVRPQLFLSILHALACFFPSNVMSLFFGLSVKAKQGLLQIIDFAGGPEGGGPSKTQSAALDGVRAFVAAGSEFFLIPANAVDAKMPTVAGLPSAQWQLWKPKIEKLPPKLKNLVEAKIVFLQFCDLSCPFVAELPTTAIEQAGSGDKHKEKEIEMNAAASTATNDTAVAENPQEDGVAYDRKLSIVHHVYFSYLAGTLEGYEQCSNKAEALWKRLEHKVESFGDDSVTKLVVLLLDRAATGSPRLKTKVLHVLQQRILQIDLAGNNGMLRERVVKFLCDCVGKEPTVSVQEAGLGVILNVADVLFSALDAAGSGAAMFGTSCPAAAGGPTAALDDSATVEAAAPSAQLQSVLRTLEETFFPTAIIDASLSNSLRLAFRAFGRLTRKQLKDAGEALRVAPKLFSLLNTNPEAAEEILEALNGVLLWFAEGVKTANAASPTAATNGTDKKEDAGHAILGITKLLDQLVDHPKPLLRREALRWLFYLFPPETAEYRFYAICKCFDADKEVATTASKAMDASRKCPSVRAMMKFLRDQGKVRLGEQLRGDGASTAPASNGGTAAPASAAVAPSSEQQVNPSSSTSNSSTISKSSLALLVEFIATQCAALGSSSESEDDEVNSGAGSGTRKRPRVDSADHQSPLPVAGATAAPSFQPAARSSLSVDDATALLCLADESGSLKAYRLLWNLAKNMPQLRTQFGARTDYFVNQILLSDNGIEWSNFVPDILDTCCSNEHRAELFQNIYDQFYGVAAAGGAAAGTSAALDLTNVLSDTVLLLLAVLVPSAAPQGGRPATTRTHQADLIIKKVTETRLQTTQRLESATLLVKKFGREKVVVAAASTAAGAEDSGDVKASMIADSQLTIGAAGSASDAFAFAAVRFLGVCGDVPRLLEISQRTHWTDRDDAMSAIALALAVDADLSIADLLELTEKDGNGATPGTEVEEQNATTSAAKKTRLKHTVVWLLCRLKHADERKQHGVASMIFSRSPSAEKDDASLQNADTVEVLSRIFVRGLHLPVANLFVCDAAAKGLVRLFGLTLGTKMNVAPTTSEQQQIENGAASPTAMASSATATGTGSTTSTGSAQLLGSSSIVVKTIFSSIQQRTQNESALVKKEEDAILAKSKDSAVIAARERQNDLKEMLFLCRQLGNLDFIIACLDQPTGGAVAPFAASLQSDTAADRLGELAKKLGMGGGRGGIGGGLGSAGSSTQQLSGVLQTLNSLMALSEKDQQKLADLMDPEKRKQMQEEQAAALKKRQQMGSGSAGASKGLLSSSAANAGGFHEQIAIEAVDVRSLALPPHLRTLVAERSTVLHQFPPYFFHTSDKLREIVVSISLNYFGIEKVQDIGPWPRVYKNLVTVGLCSPRVALREASCRCATQLIRGGRRWPELEQHWQQLWEAVIQLIDDLEPRIEPVAGPLSRAVRSLTIRLCNSSGQVVGGGDHSSSTSSGGGGTSSSGPNATISAASKNVQNLAPKREVQAALSKTLPMLLSFLHLYPHARSLCLDVIHEVAQLTSNSALLKPFLLELVPLLLESLNAMEHRKVAEYQWDFNRAGAGEKYEQARIAASKDSASFRLLRRLIPSFDRSSFEELLPALKRLLRQGVGSNTRCGVCDLFAMLANELPQVFSQASAVSTLRAVAGSLLDESMAVKSAAASAFASLAKRADDKATLGEIVEAKLLPRVVKNARRVESELADGAAACSLAAPASQSQSQEDEKDTKPEQASAGAPGVAGEEKNSTNFINFNTDLGFLETSAKALSEIHRRGCDLRSLNVRDRLASQCFFHRFHELERIHKEWNALWLEMGFTLRQAVTLEPIVGLLSEALQSQDRATRMQACRGVVNLSEELLSSSGATGGRGMSLTASAGGVDDSAKDLSKLCGALMASVENYKLAYVGASVVLRALVTMRMGLHRAGGGAALGTSAKSVAASSESSISVGAEDVRLCVDMVTSSRVQDADRAEALSVLNDVTGYVLGLPRGVDEQQPLLVVSAALVSDTLYAFIAKKLDEKEAELLQEAERDFAFAAKVRGRAPAEKLLAPVFELWATALENSKSIPEEQVLSYSEAWLCEYAQGTGTLRVGLLRALCRITPKVAGLFTAAEATTTSRKKEVDGKLLAVLYTTSNDPWSRIRKAGLLGLEAVSKKDKSLISLPQLAEFLQRFGSTSSSTPSTSTAAVGAPGEKKVEASSERAAGPGSAPVASSDASTAPDLHELDLQEAMALQSLTTLQRELQG